MKKKLWAVIMAVAAIMVAIPVYNFIVITAAFSSLGDLHEEKLKTELSTGEKVLFIESYIEDFPDSSDVKYEIFELINQYI
ncbi:hypothetical protein SAMN02745945_01878 [Peptoclostridium litorale DSM 5388]|uniref:Uncharacterized protein n=1 Tax=Peptoclostridium litorale DSM 5388 TaxID=1121324 RepID=A0A069RFN2_PEPLI|nr:hypothetical protein [Peptoclostridium litorale]KDR95849.1 hypothetical protein CLIT_8c00180 [Peptoclostridium litorale DSM 5388]SIO11410.1 hypothetical protein SAMN02745945_01878 [Peptoclostridium litorale DSM 5388]